MNAATHYYIYDAIPVADKIVVSELTVAHHIKNHVLYHVKIMLKIMPNLFCINLYD